MRSMVNSAMGNNIFIIDVVFLITIKTTCTLLLFHAIHSKSEPHNPNGAANKFELSANLSKYAPKWPKMTQNAPKWPKYDPK